MTTCLGRSLLSMKKKEHNGVTRRVITGGTTRRMPSTRTISSRWHGDNRLLGDYASWTTTLIALSNRKNRSTKNYDRSRKKRSFRGASEYFRVSNFAKSKTLEDANMRESAYFPRRFPHCHEGTYSSSSPFTNVHARYFDVKSDFTHGY